MNKYAWFLFFSHACLAEAIQTGMIPCLTASCRQEFSRMEMPVKS
ncbi:MAG: hypothetical protein ABI261_02985 [Ginsengibacter sp.]